MTHYREVYVADADPVRARGFECATEELPDLLAAITEKVFDLGGRQKAEAVLERAATTDFALERLETILGREMPVEDWRAGEALAEAYLEQEMACTFPWPALRDLRNWRASGAGADLVGLTATPEGRRLAFGEVKTSTEERWPPSVASSRSGGLVNQLEELRDSAIAQETLLLYLAQRASGATWEPDFVEAAEPYLNDPKNLSLFGVLVRDVVPKREDLESRAQALARGAKEPMALCLAALYLPIGTIPTLPDQLHSGGSGS